MRSGDTSSETRYIGGFEAELLSDFTVQTSLLSDPLYLFLRHLRQFSSAHVLAMRHRLQVLWVYTRRVAAQVVQLQTSGDVAIVDTVGVGMGVPLFSEHPISSRSSTAQPNPAFTSEAAISDFPEIICPYHLPHVGLLLRLTLGGRRYVRRSPHFIGAWG